MNFQRDWKGSPEAPQQTVLWGGLRCSDQFKPSDAAGAARKTRLSSALQETINMIFPQSRGCGKIVLL